VPAKEKNPVEASQTMLPSPPLTLPEQTIHPCRVWIHLTEDQQHHLLETIVLVCQELVPTLLRAQGSEVTRE
jgi:hypothetical protein